MPTRRPDPIEILLQRQEKLENLLLSFQRDLSSLSERIARMEGRASASEGIENRRTNEKLVTATYLSVLIAGVTFIVGVISGMLGWWPRP